MGWFNQKQKIRAIILCDNTLVSEKIIYLALLKDAN